MWMNVDVPGCVWVCVCGCMDGEWMNVDMCCCVWRAFVCMRDRKREEEKGMFGH